MLDRSCLTNNFGLFDHKRHEKLDSGRELGLVSPLSVGMLYPGITGHG